MSLRASISCRPSVSSLASSLLPSAVLFNSGTTEAAFSDFSFSWARYAACSGWLGLRQSLMKRPDGEIQGMRLGILCGESAEGGVPFASFPRTICSTRPSKTEMMMTASRDSRKTMKKMGTEKRDPAIVVYRYVQLTEDGRQETTDG